MTITPIYAAIATLFFVFLSFRVIGLRKAERISLGDGSNKELQKRARVHGNFAEYVPLAILLMLLAELQNTPGWGLHLIGLLLLTGRLLHAYAISQTPQVLKLRVAGMVLTFAALISGALTNLAAALL